MYKIGRKFYFQSYLFPLPTAFYFIEVLNILSNIYANHFILLMQNYKVFL
jgi:hypothetical protein